MTIRAFPDLSKFSGKISNVPRVIDNRIKQAIKKTAFLIEGESKKQTPVDTGRLRASIYTTVKEDSAIVQPKTN